MNTKKIIIIGVFVLIAIIAIVFGIIFGLQIMNKDKGPETEVELDISSAKIFQHDVGEMFCNLAESRKLVKINPTVETTDEKFIEVLTNKNYIIRNEINEIIRSKKAEEIEGSEGQKSLQKQILTRLNEIFNTKVISNVYFKDFIVQ